jgi:serine/threonine protein kinase
MTNGKALAKGLDCASPESIVDPLQRTIHGDQYSLGCIMYYCLTGEYPFPDKNPVKKMLGHQFEQHTPVRQLAPETPAKLEVIIDRLLAKTPEERYATTDELVAQLQTVASDSKVAPAMPAVTPAPKKTVSPSAIVNRPKPTAEEAAPQAEPAESGHPAEAASPRPVRSGAPWWLVLVGVAAGAAAGAMGWFLRG